jgi:hypothetical protein
VNKIYFFLSEYQFVDDVVRSFSEKRCEKVLRWNKKVLLLQSDFDGACPLGID